MNDVAALATTHLEVVGAPDTIHPSTDPPLLYAEETYVVRRRDDGSVHPGLAGALTVSPGALEGRLRFGNFVGLAELDGRIVRVDSRRITVPDADRMLGELVASIRNLPSRALPPTGTTFDRRLVNGNDMDLLAYLVIRDAIRGHGPHNLAAAMARILARPHERLTDERGERLIWAADRLDAGTLIDIAAGTGDRIRVPAHSSLATSPITLRLGGVLPLRIRVSRSLPTNDTLENRFVVTLLDRCLATVRAVMAHAARGGGAAMVPLRTEATRLATTLERWRLHRVFEDLRPLSRLPTTSTVLRGRPGYRDVLRLYADLLGRTQIVPWPAAMRMLGLRDIASLYEWWCFFEVVRAVSEILGPAELVDPPTETWQGAELGQGLTAHFSGGVNVEFNRAFSKGNEAKHRSYSLQLRPDILIDTPDERHIFDAKFAFEPRSSSGDDEESDEDDNPTGRARREHIHKMHTYRDALDRVGSVRVLYPGSTEEWYPVGPSGTRDGVGALPLRVGNTEDWGFLRSVLENLIPTQDGRGPLQAA